MRQRIDVKQMIDMFELLSDAMWNAVHYIFEIPNQRTRGFSFFRLNIF